MNMNDSISSADFRARRSKRSRLLQEEEEKSKILDETFSFPLSHSPPELSFSAHPLVLSFSSEDKYSEKSSIEDLTSSSGDALVESFFQNLTQSDPSFYALDASIFPHWRLREAAAHEIFKVDAYKGSSITRNMRNICVDWLVDITFEHGGPPPPPLLLPLGHAALNVEASLPFKRDKRISGEALSSAVFLLDRTLAAFTKEGTNLLPADLQLLGASALLTASQFEDVIPLSIADVVYYTASSVSSHAVSLMQRRMLRVLDWRLAVPTQKHWLKPLLLVLFPNLSLGMDSILSSSTVAQLALYILDLGLLSPNFSTLKPSLQAASALFLSRLVIDGPPRSLTSLHSDLIAALSGHAFEEIKAGAKMVHSEAVVRFGLNDKGRFKAPWKLHQSIGLKFGVVLGSLTID